MLSVHVPVSYDIGVLDGLPCNMSEFLFCHISSKASHQTSFIYKVSAKYIAAFVLHGCKKIAGKPAQYL